MKSEQLDRGINLTMDAGPHNSKPPDKIGDSLSGGTTFTGDLRDQGRDRPANHLADQHHIKHTKKNKKIGHHPNHQQPTEKQ